MQQFISPASPIAPASAESPVEAARNIMSVDTDYAGNEFEDFSYAQNIAYEALNHLRHIETAVQHLDAVGADTRELNAIVTVLSSQFEQALETIYRADQHKALGKRQAQFKNSVNTRRQYDIAVEVYNLGKFDESYDMMNKIAQEDTKDVDPELYAHAAKSMQMIREANLLESQQIVEQ